jgi:glycosyltransferase involved in cell wall biosynthesis
MAAYPKISVISPVYNVAPYIRKCIESLLSQTYSNFELILVDDGSTDESGTICDEYANRDSRIRVIHQTNQGAGAARNRGIQAAQGKYLIAPDPDDYVEPTYLEDLINATLEYPYDVVCSGYIKHIGAEIQTDKLSPFKCTTKQGVRDWLALNSFPKSEHWAYLFKLDLIKRYALEYPHITSGQDTLFLYHFFFLCRICLHHYQP